MNDEYRAPPFARKSTVSKADLCVIALCEIREQPGFRSVQEIRIVERRAGDWRIAVEGYGHANVDSANRGAEAAQTALHRIYDFDEQR
jgi:tRNA A37 methylthiotransferase MiaB